MTVSDERNILYCNDLGGFVESVDRFSYALKNAAIVDLMTAGSQNTRERRSVIVERDARKPYLRNESYHLFAQSSKQTMQAPRSSSLDQLLSRPQSSDVLERLYDSVTIKNVDATLASAAVQSEAVLEDYDASLLAKRNATYNRRFQQEAAFPAHAEKEREMIDVNDLDQIISGSPHLNNVKAGTITINSVAIPVDPDKDTFRDILERMQSSSAKVDVIYDALTDNVIIESQTIDPIEIMSDTSGFLEEANIKVGTYAIRTPDSEPNNFNDVIHTVE